MTMMMMMMMTTMTMLINKECLPPALYPTFTQQNETIKLNFERERERERERGSCITPCQTSICILKLVLNSVIKENSGAFTLLLLWL